MGIDYELAHCRVNHGFDLPRRAGVEGAGELLAETKGSNAIDATVVASAAQRGDVIVMGDADDLRPLAASVRNVTVEGLS